METTDRAQEIVLRRTRSYDWMKENFYPEWERVFKSYKCLRDPELDPDGKPDPEQTSVGLPMTWSHIRRMVARGTAQIPNLGFRAKEAVDADLISRTLMYEWDKGAQRQQKRHFTQAALFGLSIRPWYWSTETHQRTKRVDPLDPNITPETLDKIAKQYGVPVKFLVHPEKGIEIRARMLGKFGKGGLLKVKYDYTGYVGPRCDFLFIGDCYFQPDFQALQTSAWFIVERRRSLEWMTQVAKAYPALTPGFDALVRQFPQGSPRPSNMRDAQGLRERMMAAIGWSNDDIEAGYDGTKEWTILEQHVPGANPRLSFVGEQAVHIGEIPYPYDLDGKIAFTELRLIDDMLCGVGDSTARIIHGLQQLHDRTANTRMGLVYNLLRPLVGTSNRELIENPGMIKRWGGLRLVPMRGPNDMWMQGEQAALAAAATGLQDESAIMRLYQMATGESNMSMAANVDPQQNRTATGARLLAYNQDVLTKDLTDMYNESIKADAEMMFLLNRSEMSDATEFDAGQYDRTLMPDTVRERWVKAEPIHFQQDGEIVAEVGSTLADDDESKVTSATNLFQAAMSAPHLFNLQKARDTYLIAMGKARELKDWVAPPPPPPPPAEVKPSMSISVKWELLSDSERAQLMQQVGVQALPPGAEEAMAAGGPGGPSPGMGPGGPPPGPGGEFPSMPQEPPPLSMSAVMAARGRSPFVHPPSGGVV